MGIIPREFTRMIQIPTSLVIFFVAPSLGVPALNSALGNLFPNLPSNLPFQPPTNGLPLPLQQLLGGNAASAGQLSPILQAIIANFQAAQQGTAAGRSDLSSISLDLPAVEDGESLSDYIKRCTGSYGSYYGYNSGYNSYPYSSYNSGYGYPYNYNPYYPYGYPYTGAGTPTGVIVQPGTPTTGTVVNPTNPIVIQPIRTE